MKGFVEVGDGNVVNLGGTWIDDSARRGLMEFDERNPEALKDMCPRDLFCLAWMLGMSWMFQEVQKGFSSEEPVVS